MANKKISQLPLYTGPTTGFYIPVNDASETITYKVTKETLVGASGSSGSSGTSGSSGSSGTSGSSGSSGTSGSSGSSGTSGSSGSSGTSGSSGSSGTSGSSGSSGTSGSSGSSGTSGSSGSSGTSGLAFPISGLTTQTLPETTIYDYLPVLNSGETTTKKFTLETSFFSSGNTFTGNTGYNTGIGLIPIMSYGNSSNEFDRFLSLNSDTASSEFNTRQSMDVSSTNSFYGNFQQAVVIASNRGMARNNGLLGAVIASDADSGNNVGLLGASQSVVMAAKNSKINGGTNNTMIGTQAGGIESGALLSTMVAAESSYIYGARRSFVAATYDSSISSNWEFDVIMGGRSNRIVTNGERRFILGSESSKIDTSSTSTILASETATISGSPNSVIIGAKTGYVSGTTGYNNSLFNVEQCEIKTEGGTFNTVMNSYDSDITTVNFGVNTILGSTNSKINGADESEIIGSKDTVISGTSDMSMALECQSTTISGANGVVASGLSGRSVTSTYNYHTIMENQHTYKTKSFGVVNAGAVSGNIDVDLSQGSLYYFEMTGNTTPNFTNWKEGQEFNFFVFNNGTHTVPDITITGGGAVYVKAGSVNPTNNGRTYYTGTIINGDCWLDEHLNFQAI